MTSAIGKDIVANGDGLEPVGSWTTIMKQVTDTKTKQCVLEYLEVIPIASNDTICKWYVDMVLQMAGDLEVECIFSHADEAVHCKLVIIQWLNEGKYDKIITLLGGFHTLLVKQEVCCYRTERLVGGFKGCSWRVCTTSARRLTLFQRPQTP